MRFVTFLRKKLKPLGYFFIAAIGLWVALASDAAARLRSAEERLQVLAHQRWSNDGVGNPHEKEAAKEEWRQSLAQYRKADRTFIWFLGPLAPVWPVFEWPPGW